MLGEEFWDHPVVKVDPKLLIIKMIHIFDDKQGWQ